MPLDPPRLLCPSPRKILLFHIISREALTGICQYVFPIDFGTLNMNLCVLCVANEYFGDMMHSNAFPLS